VREIRRYIERAQQAALGASPLERALIQAMTVRYGRAPEKDQKVYEAQGASPCGAAKPAKNTDPQDVGCASGMAAVLRQVPNDPDVVTHETDAQSECLILPTCIEKPEFPYTSEPTCIAKRRSRLALVQAPQHPQA
jgi:hypothetical protein